MFMFLAIMINMIKFVILSLQAGRYKIELTTLWPYVFTPAGLLPS